MTHLLLVSGSQGTGKTLAATIMASHLQSNSKTVTVLSMYDPIIQLVSSISGTTEQELIASKNSASKAVLWGNTRRLSVREAITEGATITRNFLSTGVAPSCLKRINESRNLDFIVLTDVYLTSQLSYLRSLGLTSSHIHIDCPAITLSLPVTTTRALDERELPTIATYAKPVIHNSFGSPNVSVSSAQAAYQDSLVKFLASLPNT